jgi:predicted enzyme related to lactoylglutathione lyase
MSDRDGFQPGVPCWVDTWQPDAAAAAAFYTELFGWQAERSDPRYVMCRLRGRDVAGVGAGPAAADAPPAWTTYVQVRSADDAAATVTGAGGRVVSEPFDSLDGGRIAIVADPAGAVLGVWQPGAHRGAQVVNEAGAWSMSLLSTPDPGAAKAFYDTVFGWGAEGFAMGDAEIALCRLDGYVGGEPAQPVPRDVVAAIMPAPPGAPPRWSVDFWVRDAEATAERAADLGGAVVVAPFDTPVSKQAVLADPAGAAFSVSTAPVLPPPER